MRKIRFGLTLLGLVFAGLAVGFGVTSAFTTPSDPAPAPTESTTSTTPTTSTAPPIPTSTAVPPSTPAPTTTAAPTPLVMLAWTAGGLPPDLAEAVESVGELGAFTSVHGEPAPVVAAYDGDEPVMNLTDGYRVELDSISVDPGEYAPFADAEDQAAIRALQEGEALLTATSAQLRSIVDTGSLVLTQGRTLQIVGVISDQSGAGAELVVSRQTGDKLGFTTPRFILSEILGNPDLAELALREAFDNPVPLRVRVTGESPFLRHGDAVLTQAAIKARFGEFSFRDIPGVRDVTIDPAWVSENIVEAEVPILGSVRCHRRFVDTIRDVLTELEEKELGHLVNPGQYAGCFGPRRIGASQALSHHSWGVAIDLNIGSNPRGNFSTQDQRLVNVMEGAGLAWGGHWLIPDPGHYEFITER